MNTYFKEKQDGRFVHYESSFYDRNYEETISDVESRMYAKPYEVEEYLNNTLVISSKLARPSWWNEYSLGYYSNKKMEIIYAVPGVFELLNSDGYLWWDDEIQVAIYKLNKYCRENNIKYNPSDENVITFAYNSK